MNGLTALAVPAVPTQGPDDDAARLLNKLGCYVHYYGPWQEDVERDDNNRKTESRGCKECGYTQTRPA